MAIDLSALFGQQPDYSQFISPAETQRMQSNANQQALLNAAIALLGSSGTQPRPISTGQALGGALAAGMGGYNEAFDRSLKQMVTGIQLGEYRKKQQAQEQYQKMLKAAERPQNIPMATGQGSQLEMLMRPEFGGDMAQAETVSALQANLPRTVDPTLANTAALQYLAQIDPAKYAELTTKQAKLPGKIDEFVTAKQMKLIPENMSFQQFEEIGKKPLVQVMPTEKNLAEIDKGVVENLTNQAVSARQFATSATQINELLKGKGGGKLVQLTADTAKTLGLQTDTVTANDLAKSLGVQTAVKVRPPGSGGTSNIEFEAYISAVPSLANSEAGRDLMADANRRFAERAEKIADFSRNLYKKNEFSLTSIQEYDAKLGAVLPKDFYEKANSIPKSKDLGIPSARGVRFLGFEPLPTGQK
jgi:hypothetical protein